MLGVADSRTPRGAALSPPRPAAGCASVTVFGVTTMCNVLRSLHGDNPALFTQSQVTGIAVGFSFLSFLINSAPSKYFGWLTYVTATNLIIGLLATIIVLPSVSPKQRRAADVFGNFVSNAHNTPAACVWLQQGGQFAAPTHIRPAHRVQRAWAPGKPDVVHPRPSI